MSWPTRSEFDYIVAGAGTAGCVLAARLSQDDGTRVLLLEAGEPVRTPATTLPDAWNVLVGGAADWGNFTTAQADAGILPYPRGRLLGGSGEINAMTHMRGHPAVYDAWAAAGAAGWAHADLLPYFRRTERTTDRDPQLRGTDGPVRVAPIPEADRHPAACAFAEALEAMGFPVTDDLNGSQHEGVGWPDLAVDSGHRASPAAAYLRPVEHRPNLTIKTGCLVTRLLIRQRRCIGVSYLHHGVLEEAHTIREVIVSAGAVGSPQILLLSGIGPPSHLKSVGIDPIVELPGVGANLQDHPAAMACYVPEDPLPPSRYNHEETYAAVRSALAGAWPDLQLFPILLPIAPGGYRTPLRGFALVVSATAPDSRGTVRLTSEDPLAALLIDPGLLRDERDLDRLGAGLVSSAALRRAPHSLS
jgi:choline dehydrogenase